MFTLSPKPSKLSTSNWQRPPPSPHHPSPAQLNFKLLVLVSKQCNGPAQRCLAAAGAQSPPDADRSVDWSSSSGLHSSSTDLQTQPAAPLTNTRPLIHYGTMALWHYGTRWHAEAKLGQLTILPRRFQLNLSFRTSKTSPLAVSLVKPDLGLGPSCHLFDLEDDKVMILASCLTIVWLVFFNPSH